MPLGCVLPNPSDTLHGLLSPQRIIGYRSTHRLFELWNPSGIGLAGPQGDSFISV